MTYRLLTVKDLAERWNCSKATIYKLNHFGEMPPAVRHGKRTIGWKPETIEQWETDHETPLR
ncbi:helix-turn-helix domain-containing protein [Bifidobacterium magnum]|uniref:helix-turn-helix transcriptional regulator n=1 Tax=Bifidobacterium magnum TaxID=1692 RepID=UPI0009DC2162